jgi:conjugal transfer/entry exclusion protein
MSEFNTTTLPMAKSFLRRKGATMRERVQGISHALNMISQAPTRSSLQEKDPLIITRSKLESDTGRLQALEAEVQQEIGQAVEAALLSKPAVEASLP